MKKILYTMIFLSVVSILLILPSKVNAESYTINFDNQINKDVSEFLYNSDDILQELVSDYSSYSISFTFSNLLNNGKQIWIKIFASNDNTGFKSYYRSSYTSGLFYDMNYQNIQKYYSITIYRDVNNFYYSDRVGGNRIYNLNEISITQSSITSQSYARLFERYSTSNPTFEGLIYDTNRNLINNSNTSYNAAFKYIYNNETITSNIGDILPSYKTLYKSKEIKFSSGYYQYNSSHSDIKVWSLDFDDFDGNNYVYEYSYDGINYDLYDDSKIYSSKYNLDIYARVKDSENNIISSNLFSLDGLLEKPNYLDGYKLVYIDTNTKFVYLSGLDKGRVYIPKQDFADYSGKLAYWDLEKESMNGDSVILDYDVASDGAYIYQDFDLSKYEGADLVMFNKFIYLENMDYQDFSYYIYVPNEIYVSKSRPEPNGNLGNNFEFEYIDPITGDITNHVIVSNSSSGEINTFFGTLISGLSSFKSSILYIGTLFTEFFYSLPVFVQTGLIVCFSLTILIAIVSLIL